MELMQEMKHAESMGVAHILQYYFSSEQKEEVWMITNSQKFPVRITNKLMTKKKKKIRLGKYAKI